MAELQPWRISKSGYALRAVQPPRRFVASERIAFTERKLRAWPVCNVSKPGKVHLTFFARCSIFSSSRISRLGLIPYVFCPSNSGPRTRQPGDIASCFAVRRGPPECRLKAVRRCEREEPLSRHEPDSGSGPLVRPSRRETTLYSQTVKVTPRGDFCAHGLFITLAPFGAKRKSIFRDDLSAGGREISQC